MPKSSLLEEFAAVPPGICPINKALTSNVVGTAYYRRDINLMKLARHFISAKWNPTQFNFLKFSYIHPSGSALMFEQSAKRAKDHPDERGCILCVGTKHIYTNLYIICVTRQRVEAKTNERILFNRFDISNVVYTSSLPYYVDLAKFNANEQNANYMPEDFPGLHYIVFANETVADLEAELDNNTEQLGEAGRASLDGYIIAVFERGRYNLVGFKNPNYVRIAIDRFRDVAEKYRRDELPQNDVDKFRRRERENEDALQKAKQKRQEFDIDIEDL